MLRAFRWHREELCEEVVRLVEGCLARIKVDRHIRHEDEGARSCLLRGLWLLSPQSDVITVAVGASD